MKVGYKYASPSRCTQVDNQTTLGFSPDLSRDESLFLWEIKASAIVS